ncbi:MAG: hypothetical protein IPG96_01070 [Proteobacteria bacterium]|nr:hypothetical protein [Pseudomonadota bacterium]
MALRSDFSETAFFLPQLLTDAQGQATIAFTVPDSVTSWQVWVHALTRELSGGSLNRTTQSIKDLMVRPYLPRFLREADRAELEVVINSAAERTLDGTAELDIVDPATGRSLRADFGLAQAQARQPFSVAPRASSRLRFALTAPARLDQVAFKVVASAGSFSDGELRPLPILPGRMHLAQSRFATLRERGRRELYFADLARADDPTRLNEQLVVTLDAQLFYGVLAALPYLVRYPYECTEQTVNRFVSTGILASLYGHFPAVGRMAQQLAARPTQLERWDAPDPNRKLALEETPWLQLARGGALPQDELLNVLDPRIAEAQRQLALAQLSRSQTASGGFPWFPGGPPSPWMTLYLVSSFAKAREFGVALPAALLQRAWAYLHQHYLERVGDRVHGPRRLLGVGDLPQLHALELPRRHARRRGLRRRGAAAHARLQLPALARAFALPQGLSGADAASRRTRRRGAAGLGQRDGCGQERARSGHLLGARGPRLALVQRHDRDPRLRHPRLARAGAQGSAARGAGAVVAAQQAAQSLEVDAGHRRGDLRAGALLQAARAARPGGGGAGDDRRPHAALRLPGRALHGRRQPARGAGRAARRQDDGAGKGDAGEPGLDAGDRDLALLDRAAAAAGARRSARGLAPLFPARQPGP